MSDCRRVAVPELLQFKDASSMRDYSRQQRQAGKRIALVPTMVSVQPAALELAHCLIINDSPFAGLPARRTYVFGASSHVSPQC